MYLIAIVFAYNNYVCVIMMIHIKETASATDQIKHRSFRDITIGLVIFLWFFIELYSCYGYDPKQRSNDTN